MSSESPPVTREKVLRVFAAGFVVVIAALFAATYIGWQSIELTQEATANLASEQVATMQLVEGIQRGQVTLRLVVHRILQDPDSAKPEEILTLLDGADAQIRDAVAKARDPEHGWQGLERTATALTAEARRVLHLDQPTSRDSASLFRHQEDLMFAIRELVTQSQSNARAVQQNVNQRSERLQRQTLYLLAACLGVALLGTVFTVRLANQLFKRMEDQAVELSRVSWQLLEKQELAAQRFSHELHDELGQSLAAVKANLQAIHPRSASDTERIADCSSVIEESIETVREMSQLLHPRVLDDFGLVAGLRWLCERFSQRTGIQVDYDSNFDGHLPDELRTHVFRIAQEALTNAAKHSGATRIQMRLSMVKEGVSLSIVDNGKGIAPSLNGKTWGMGLLGMRARARMAGGQLTVDSGEGQGTSILVAVPFAHVR